ncbi:MAG: HAD-IA family hydrolase [Anaerolineae bacterium]|nr:HAD-IA family hydrolase [Anaerolineae bacterium]
MTTHFTAQALCFDLDGTLVHSIEAINECWQLWANKTGIDLDLVMRTHPGRRMLDTIRIVAPHLNADAEAVYVTALETSIFTNLRPMPTAFNLLNTLPVDRWAIVTSGSTLIATTRLMHTHLPMPTVLVTSKDVKNGKPAPDPFVLAAQRLGVPAAQCIAFEDAPSGIRSAKTAGMTVIGLATTHSADELHEADAVVAGLDCVKVAVNEDGQISVRLS